MSDLSFNEVVARLYRSLLARDVGNQELAERISSSGDTITIKRTIELVEELISSDEFSHRFGTNSNFHRITDADIFYAYKFLLGRLPENIETYQDKRKLSSTNILIEELAASDEFKNNNILKSTISVRRKPKGLGEVANSQFAQVKKNVLVISGCQGRMIADLIQAGGGFGFVESIYLTNDTYNKFIASNGQIYSDLLEWADLIYTQKQAVYDILFETHENRHKIRLMPLIEYTGLQPDQCYLTDSISGTPIVGILGEYHSTIITASYLAGLDLKAAQDCFTNTTYEALHFNELKSLSKERFIAQQTTTGYPLRYLFDKWETSEKWMRTINHPIKKVLSDLVKHAIEKEGITYLNGSDDFVIDDLSSNIDWPAYGSTQENQDGPLAEELRFKLPKVFSGNVNSAAYIDLRQFIEFSYKTLDGYTIETISANQLGREIDLRSHLEVLRQKHQIS